jgi:CYTH domain-containing protein
VSPDIDQNPKYNRQNEKDKPHMTAVPKREMDKTYRTELFRTFLIDALPAPLTPASSHIQIFDNYIANTRMRLRSIRVPETKEWSRMLQQRFPVRDDFSHWKIAEMHLDDAEYAQLAIFEGTEIRKNRYFHEFDSRMVLFDVYLGPLWGVSRARVDFETESELVVFPVPPFAVFEISNQPFFDDANLVNQKLEDVKTAVSSLTPISISKAVRDQ